MCYVHKYRRLPDDQDPLEFHLQLLQPLIRTTTDSEQTSVGLNDTFLLLLLVLLEKEKKNWKSIRVRFLALICHYFYYCYWISFLLSLLYKIYTQAFHSLFPIITYTHTELAYNLLFIHCVHALRHRTIWRTLVANKLIKNVQKQGKYSFSCQFSHNYHKFPH